jgi:hypothetical protein
MVKTVEMAKQDDPVHAVVLVTQAHKVQSALLVYVIHLSVILNSQLT